MNAKPLTRRDIENLTTRSARAWVRVRATVEENERLREVNAELLAALDGAVAEFKRRGVSPWAAMAVCEGAIAKARSAPLGQVSR